MDKRKTNR